MVVPAVSDILAVVSIAALVVLLFIAAADSVKSSTAVRARSVPAPVVVIAILPARENSPLSDSIMPAPS